MSTKPSHLKRLFQLLSYRRPKFRPKCKIRMRAKHQRSLCRDLPPPKRLPGICPVSSLQSRQVVHLNRATFSVHTGAFEQQRNRAAENLCVEPQRKIFNIRDVQRDSSFPRNQIAALKLCEASQSGAHLKTAGLLRRITFSNFKKSRTGTDQTHFTAENIPELRKFVDAPAAQETPRTGDTRIRGGCFETMSGIAGILYHGAEFPLIEGFSIASGNAQLKENTAGRIKRHAKSDQCEKRGHYYQAKNRRSNIKYPLDRELKFTWQLAHPALLKMSSGLILPGLILPRREVRLRECRD